MFPRVGSNRAYPVDLSHWGNPKARYEVSIYLWEFALKKACRASCREVKLPECFTLFLWESDTLRTSSHLLSVFWISFSLGTQRLQIQLWVSGGGWGHTCWRWGEHPRRCLFLAWSWRKNTQNHCTHTIEEADSLRVGVWGQRELLLLTALWAWNKQLFFPTDYYCLVYPTIPFE